MLTHAALRWSLPPFDIELAHGALLCAIVTMTRISIKVIIMVLQSDVPNKK